MTEPLPVTFEPDLPEPARRFLWAYLQALSATKIENGPLRTEPWSFNYKLGLAMALGVAAALEQDVNSEPDVPREPREPAPISIDRDGHIVFNYGPGDVMHDGRIMTNWGPKSCGIVFIDEAKVSAAQSFGWSVTGRAFNLVQVRRDA